VKFCILRVPIYASDKDSKTYSAKIRQYDMGSTEDFLIWRKTLNTQIKNNGFAGNYEMVVNLAQVMLVGSSLDDFVKERRAQEKKNLTLLAKTTMELTPQHIYDYAIFKFAICSFDTQSGWRDALERQREYTRRDLSMGKLNPEKFSQIMQEINRYFYFIPMENNAGKDKTPIMKAYGKALPNDEIKSIMRIAIPPEWTVNVLALGKEPWKFRDFNDQVATYCQQW
jgi:hypothetical protein